MENGKLEVVSLNKIENSERFIEDIASVFSNAFINDPLWSNTYPDHEMRKKVLYNFHKVIAKYGIRYGDTKVIFSNNNDDENIGHNSIAAVLILLHVKKTIISSWKMIKCGIIPVFFSPFMKMVFKNSKVFKETERFHKSIINKPHLYGFEFAVDPKYQGKGYGRALIMEIENVINEKSNPVPVYLETNNPNNVSLYEKFGFKLMGKWASEKTPTEAFFMLREK